MTAFVLDCSIAIGWCFEDEASPAGDALLERTRDHGAAVPALWHWEVANVLAMAVRKGRLAPGDAQARLSLLGALPITADPLGAARAFRETFLLAQMHALTSYDAAYLELAMRLGLPLATNDNALRAAAEAVGVPLLP